MSGMIRLDDAMRLAGFDTIHVADACLGRGKICLKSVDAWYTPRADMYLSMGKEYAYRNFDGTVRDFVAPFVTYVVDSRNRTLFCGRQFEAERFLTRMCNENVSAWLTDTPGTGVTRFT